MEVGYGGVWLSWGRLGGRWEMMGNGDVEQS